MNTSLYEDVLDMIMSRACRMMNVECQMARLICNYPQPRILNFDVYYIEKFALTGSIHIDDLTFAENFHEVLRCRRLSFAEAGSVIKPETDSRDKI